MAEEAMARARSEARTGEKARVKELMSEVYFELEQRAGAGAEGFLQIAREVIKDATKRMLSAGAR